MANRYAPEPALAKRSRPWIRRYPRWAAVAVLAATATVLLVVATLVLVRGHRLAQWEALATLAQFRQDRQEAQFLLLQPDANRHQQDEGLARCRLALSRFGVLDNPSWREHGAIQYLPASERELLREEIGTLLFLLARVTARPAEMALDPSEREDPLQAAHRLNVLAQTCYAPEEAPQALWLQRADLAQLAGEETVAQCLRDKARQVPRRGGRDLYLAAQEHFSKREFRQGLRLLQQVRREDPQNLWVHWLLASCSAGLRQHAEAAHGYSTCIALQPEASWAYFRRGLASLEQQDDTAACADFDQVIRRRPDLLEAYVHRARARLGLANYAGALADLTHALEHGAPAPRLYWLRAQVREQAGDRAGAWHDRAAGLRSFDLGLPP